ncbi:MAG: cyanoexosortase C [Phormidesmis sp.]
MKTQIPKRIFNDLLQASLRTRHSRLVTLGLLIGFIFWPVWLYDVIQGTLQGAASLLLTAAFALGIYQLWVQRSALSRLRASSEDRWLGHLILIAGIGVVPFAASTEWSQKLIWLMILVGIALSTWGLSFFSRCPASIFLIALGLFPQPTAVGKTLWEAFTPPAMLERFMAWSGGVGLRLIGQSAEANWTIITLPGGSVDVNWGCSGYDLACIAAVASLLMALFFKQSFWKSSLILAMGIAVALVANVPRIMLVAMASAYWGEESFEFWHGFWGGQIFLSLLFSVHYYIVMAIVKRRSPNPTTK